MSVDKILWCDHSIEISLEVLSCGVICFKNILQLKMNLGFLSNLPLVTFGSERVNDEQSIYVIFPKQVTYWNLFTVFVKAPFPCFLGFYCIWWKLVQCSCKKNLQGTVQL